MNDFGGLTPVDEARVDMSGETPITEAYINESALRRVTTVDSTPTSPSTWPATFRAAPPARSFPWTTATT